MNATIPFFSLSLDRAETPEQGFAAVKRYGPLLLSVFFHLAIAGAVFLLAAAGGGGGGMLGSGEGRGAGSGGRILLAGVIALHGEGQAGQESAVRSRDDEATAPEESGAEESALAESATEEIRADETAVVEASAVQQEFPGAQRREMEEGIVPAREPQALPAPAMKKPPAATARNKTEARPPENTRPNPAQTAEIRTAGSGRESAARAAASTAGPERTDAADGSGNGEKDLAAPGGGSGVMPGRGGDADGEGHPGLGLSAEADAKPKVIRRVKVRYPEHARKHNITGHVLLRFHLDEKGGVSQLQVVRSEPPGVFEEAALAAVRQWRFAPAMKNGRAIPYWVELPMPFLLQ